MTTRAPAAAAAARCATGVSPSKAVMLIGTPQCLAIARPSEATCGYVCVCWSVGCGRRGCWCRGEGVCRGARGREGRRGKGGREKRRSAQAGKELRTTGSNCRGMPKQHALHVFLSVAPTPVWPAASPHTQHTTTLSTHPKHTSTPYRPVHTARVSAPAQPPATAPDC